MKLISLGALFLGLISVVGCETIPMGASTTQPATEKSPQRATGVPELPVQTVLVLDDGKSTSVAWEGARNFNADELTAMIRGRGKKINDPDDIVLVSDQIALSGDGRTITAIFPSLVAWEFDAKSIELYVGTATKTPWRTFDTNQIVYRLKQTDAAPAQAQQAFEVNITSSSIVSEDLGKGSLRIDFRRLDESAKIQISIEGAQIESVGAEPNGIVVPLGAQWVVQNTGAVMLKLGNLNPSTDVILSARDSKGVTYSPVRFRVVRSGGR